MSVTAPLVGASVLYFFKNVDLKFEICFTEEEISQTTTPCWVHKRAHSKNSHAFNRKGASFLSGLWYFVLNYTYLFMISYFTSFNLYCDTHASVFNIKNLNIEP